MTLSLKFFRHSLSVASVIAVLFVSLCADNAYAIGKGEKSLGFRAGYTSSNQSAVAGMYFSMLSAGISVCRRMLITLSGITAMTLFL